MANVQINISSLTSSDSLYKIQPWTFDTLNPYPSISGNAITNSYTSTTLTGGDTFFAFSTSPLSHSGFSQFSGENARFEYQIYGFTLTPDGLASNPFLISPNTPQYGDDLQYNPSAQSLPNGGYVVTWENILSSGHNEGIYLRTFNALY